jgi:phosphoglycerate dehydrogenase-like enzyme
MTNKTRVLLWTDTPGAYLDAIAAAGLSDRVIAETLKRSESPSAEQLAETGCLLSWGPPAGVLPHMKQLRWAQSLTAGVEGWIALPDLPESLALTCARGTHRQSMPENILGALFHIAKPFAAIVGDQATGTWNRRMAQPLNGKTLGIVGLGAIGADLARIASALGMRVIGTRRRADQAVPYVDTLLPPDQADRVLAESDFVVLLLPATPETENFIGAERLAKMKPSAWLLNFGRGHLIDDAALIDAVNNKLIAGAILDVFRQEPLPSSHPFWKTEGILVLPHIGGGHPTRDRVVAQLFVDNLGRFLDGKPLLEQVDRAVGY